MDLHRKITVCDGAHTESAIALSKSLEAVPELSESICKVHLERGKNGNGGAVHITSAAKLHRLRFTIEGSARLYAFRVTTVANGESPTP